MTNLEPTNSSAPFVCDIRVSPCPHYSDAINDRYSDLLYIHRTSFAQAIRAEPADPLNHKFGPSVLATYRSATTLISTLRSLYAVHQNMASEQWFFWSGVFSSCVSVYFPFLFVRTLLRCFMYRSCWGHWS